MKKKFILSLFILLIGLCTGCGDNSGGVTNIDKLDSKVDYYTFRNRKIYLTNSFEDYVLQFKGLGCKLEAESSNISGKIDIDDINSSDHEFYSLSTTLGSTSVDIECYTEGEYVPASFSLSFAYNTEETLLKNKVVDYWSVSPIGENVKLYFDGTELSFGGDDNKDSTKDDVKKMLGSGYEENTYYANDIDTTIGDYNYSFSFRDSDDSLTLVTVSDYSV